MLDEIAKPRLMYLPHSHVRLREARLDTKARSKEKSGINFVVFMDLTMYQRT